MKKMERFKSGRDYYKAQVCNSLRALTAAESTLTPEMTAESETLFCR
jgi:hypothetical protein